VADLCSKLAEVTGISDEKVKFNWNWSFSILWEKGRAGFTSIDSNKTVHTLMSYTIKQLKVVLSTTCLLIQLPFFCAQHFIFVI